MFGCQDAVLVCSPWFATGVTLILSVLGLLLPAERMWLLGLAVTGALWGVTDWLGGSSSGDWRKLRSRTFPPATKGQLTILRGHGVSCRSICGIAQLPTSNRRGDALKLS